MRHTRWDVQDFPVGSGQVERGVLAICRRLFSNIQHCIKHLTLNTAGEFGVFHWGGLEMKAAQYSGVRSGGILLQKYCFQTEFSELASVEELGKLTAFVRQVVNLQNVTSRQGRLSDLHHHQFQRFGCSHVGR